MLEKKGFCHPEMKSKVLKNQPELTVTEPALRLLSVVFWGGLFQKTRFTFRQRFLR